MTSARITLGLVALGLAVSCGGGASEQRNVLVVTVDTLRRDAVGFHGGPTTATMDALAAEGFVCEDAYTVAPVTLPSHASLLSGLYPASHGARDNGPMRVPSGVVTLAERLRERGWRTLASVSAFVLDPTFGIDQGFERYDAPAREFSEVSVNVAQIRAAEAVDKLLAGLDEVGAGEPWFAWLHLYDPHAPYDAPGAAAGLAKTDAYAAEVQYVDAQLRRLFDALRERGAWDDLVVVLASDHGEGLDDGREPTHGYFVHDTTMRIPLVIRDPRAEPARWPHPASLVDVAPTLLELLEVPARRDEFDGVSLAAGLRGQTKSEPSRVLLFESYLPWISHGWAPFEGGLDHTYKVVRSREREAYARQELGEQVNLIGPEATVIEPPRQAHAMLGEVDRRMTELMGRFTGEEIEGDEATAAMLQALGYAGADAMVGVTERPDFDALPDTYAKRPMIDRLDALGEALARGQTQRATDELRALVELDPENAAFLERLGGVLLLENTMANLDEAERHLRRAAELRPGRAQVHESLATCAMMRRDIPTAEREIRTALVFEPDKPTALYNLAFLLAQRADMTGDAAAATEDREEARELLDRLLTQLPDGHPRRPGIASLRTQLAQSSGGQ